MIQCSVGVFAYNEEKNIGRALEALLAQQTKEVEIVEILVVASGCTDRTVQIAQDFAKSCEKPGFSQPGCRHEREVRILEQAQREGKWSAINLFLQEAKHGILVMESADTIPEKNTVELLVAPFADSKVGMTGAHPVPTNKQNSFMGFAAHLLWGLHHLISLEHPKMGEMVAFRKVIHSIPALAVDEAYIEAMVLQKGYKVLYVPKAIVYNKGPEKVREFLEQRRRVHAGHLQLEKLVGHKVSTGNVLRTLWVLTRHPQATLRFWLFTPFVILLEAVGTLLGYWDYYVARKDHVIWQTIQTTKELR